MPKVGNTKFPYTSAGMRDAEVHAKTTGQKVQKMKKGGKVKKGYRKGGLKRSKQEVQMNLLKDIWAHLKEWSDWKLRDWIKAGIVAIIVLIVLKAIIIPGAQWLIEDHNF